MRNIEKVIGFTHLQLMSLRRGISIFPLRSAARSTYIPILPIHLRMKRGKMASMQFYNYLYLVLYLLLYLLGLYFSCPFPSSFFFFLSNNALLAIELCYDVDESNLVTIGL